MDYQVKAVQEWLLEKYKGRKEFDSFVQEKNFRANGNTGNNTMQALRMALQYELGITGPTGNFGPGTIAATPTVAYGLQTTNLNIIKILEGGMWCHGYNPGRVFTSNLLTEITEKMNTGLLRFVKDVGVTSANNTIATITPHLWKSLLSTDAYSVQWTNGNLQLRDIQRKINNTIINGKSLAKDYNGGYIPTDGLGGRTLNKILIYYLQALMGLTPSEATGNFGPATQDSLPTIDSNLVSDGYMDILKAGLILNRIYIPSLNSDWNVLKPLVLKFQNVMALPTTGVVDKTTWMSLLVSYGDKTRNPNACDTRFEIDYDKCGYLKAKGIKYVGRYLTGGSFKELRAGEAQFLKSQGLTVFPIFQDNGNTTNISYYTRSQGITAAISASDAAKEHGFPAGTTIYFAVDLDTYEYQIKDSIIPFFSAINEYIVDYKVGIYATRLGCSMVMSEGLASQCFVSNMSSGWAGNLGYPMPINWTFEQYVEHKNIIGIEGLWDLDYCMYSGNGDVFMVDDTPTEDALEKIKLKRAVDMAYKTGHALKVPGLYGIKNTIKEFEKEYIIGSVETTVFKVKISNSLSIGSDHGVINFYDGLLTDGRLTIESAFSNSKIGTDVSFDLQLDEFINQLEAIAVEFENGIIGIKFSITPNGTARVEFTVYKEEVDLNGFNLEYEVTFIVEFLPMPNSSEPEFDSELATYLVIGIVVLVSIPLIPHITGASAFAQIVASITAVGANVGGWVTNMLNSFGRWLFQ